MYPSVLCHVAFPAEELDIVAVIVSSIAIYMMAL
jgi:hypothetical protein